MRPNEFESALKKSPAYATDEGKSIIDDHLRRIGEAETVDEKKRVIDEMTGRLRAVLDAPDTPEPPETPPGTLPNIVRSPESYADMTPEQIKEDIERQYNGRLATMRYFGIIDDADNPEAECIDNVRRRAPTHEEIWQELSRSENSAKMEAIKTLKSPKMIITPIGMPLSTLADKAGSQNGRLRVGGEVLEQNPVYRGDWDINSDVTGKMKYFPSEYERDNHGGKTKQELLTGDSPFPGWQVVFVDGEQEVKDRDQTATDFLDEWNTKGYDALTTEEVMMLHPEGVVAPFGDENEAHPHNRANWEWALGSYIPEMGEKGAVRLVSWVVDGRRLRLIWDRPDDRAGNLGPRRAVRVF